MKHFILILLLFLHLPTFSQAGSDEVFLKEVGFPPKNTEEPHLQKEVFQIKDIVQLEENDFSFYFNQLNAFAITIMRGLFIGLIINGVVRRSEVEAEIPPGVIAGAIVGTFIGTFAGGHAVSDIVSGTVSGTIAGGISGAIVYAGTETSNIVHAANAFFGAEAGGGTALAVTVAAYADIALINNVVMVAVAVTTANFVADAIAHANESGSAKIHKLILRAVWIAAALSISAQ